MRWYQRFFRRELTEKRLDVELRFHLDQRVADLVAAGAAPEEARRRARLEFGGLNQVKEQCRDIGCSHIIETFVQDIRYGLRQLRRNPGFTIVAVLTLALGIAVNTTMFSAVSAILIRKPPVKDPDRLCAVSSKNLIKGYDLEPVSPLDFESWRKQNNVFEAMAADTGASFTLTGDGEPESVAGDRVTPGYFKILGVLPTLGRPFLASEAQAGNNRVVILSNPLWRERFRSDPNVIGKNLKINGESYTVVGVMPPVASSFSWLAFPRLWTPLAFEPKDLAPSSRDNRYVGLVLGRLKPGVTIKHAQAEMGSIASQLAHAYPKTDKGWGITVQTLQEYEIRSAYVTNGLMLLMTVVGLVLLIACANIAGLLLARGAGRAHELAVRSAVGASRGRLLRQMFVESLLIGAAGGAAGLLMSFWGIDLLRAGFNFNDYGRRQAAGFHMDPPTLLFTLAVSLLATFVFGLVPALRASKANPRDALGESGRTGSSGFAHSRLRSALVAGEIALALLLLSGAGIIIREVIRELNEPNGFNPNHILVAQLDLKGHAYEKPDAQVAFFRQVTEKVRSIAGVESAGADTCVPTGCNYSTPFSIVGDPPVPETKRPSADYFVVGPGYFHTMQIPFMKGRDFSDSDDARAPVVAVVNQEFARRFFPKSDAIGRQIKVDRGQNRKAEIVGIVGNVNDYIGQLTPRPQIYESYLQMAQATMALVVRLRLARSALAPVLRRAVWAVDKDQPVGRIQTMEDLAADNMGGDKMMVALMAIFAGLALGLATVGIYGVVSYSVNQRTREIGIRMALGGQKKDVLGLVLRQGGLLTGIGCAIGIVLAFPLPRLFAGMFNGFAHQGPLVSIVVPFLVGVVSLLATYIPARRAAKVDPMVALRYE
jgi:putative ABC transport system permease protein